MGLLVKNAIIDLKERLSQIIVVDSIDIEKLYEELLSFFSESISEYSIRRHRELQKEGFKNKDIYTKISKEIIQRLFKGKELSARQVKRIIYKED